MTSYPLHIEAMVDHGGQILAVFSKGHHPAGSVLAVDRFLAAATCYLADLGLADDDWTLDPAAVRFETWRCTPAGPHDPDRDVLFHPATPGRRGAFP